MRTRSIGSGKAKRFTRGGAAARVKVLLFIMHVLHRGLRTGPVGSGKAKTSKGGGALESAVSDNCCLEVLRESRLGLAIVVLFTLVEQAKLGIPLSDRSVCIGCGWIA